MKKGTVLLLFFFGITSSSFALVLKVGVYNNPPLSYFVSQKATGVLVEFFNYVAKREGWKVKYVRGERGTLLNELERKDIDAVLGVVKDEKTSSEYLFTNEYLFSNWGQVYVPLMSNVSSFFDLKGKKVGVLKGDPFYRGNFGISYLLSRLDVHVRFVEFKSYVGAFHAAESHFVDAVVANGLFGNANAFRYGLKITPLVFSPVEERIAFSKEAKNEHVLKVVDGYVERMKKNPHSILNVSLRNYMVAKGKVLLFPRWVLYIFYVGLIVVVGLFVNVIVLQKLVNRRTKEVERKNEELNEKNKELVIYNAEINAMNEELQNTYRILEELSNRFQSMLVALSQLDVAEVGEEEFLEQVLKAAMKIVPRARYGSVSSFENGKWKVVALYGYSKDDLPCGEKVEFQASKLIEGRDGVKTLLLPLLFSENLVGCLAIGIEAKESSFAHGEREILERLAKIATAFYVSRKYVRYQQELQDRIVMVLVKALEKHDKYTQGHSARVAKCSYDLAKRLGMSEERCRRTYQAALLHDIGKLFVPLSILNKDGPLTFEEYEEIKKHPSIGAELIEEGAKLKDTALIVRHHHERWDGKGYPSGLKGEEIPVESRIMTVCDTYDSMVSDRPYRRALGKEKALDEIRRNAGTQFDPRIVRLFLQMMKEEE